MFPPLIFFCHANNVAHDQRLTDVAIYVVKRKPITQIGLISSARNPGSGPGLTVCGFLD